MPIRLATAELGRRNRTPSRPSIPVLAAIVLAASAGAGCTLFRDDGVPKSQRPSNQWQIAFYETAKSDGSIEFLVSPAGGEPISVSVPVAINQTREEIAAAAQGAFASSLGASYQVKMDRGADIHIGKASRRQPDFALTLIRLTAQNVKVDLDRE